MNVTKFRLEKGWSYDYMAKESGVSKNSWIKIANGEQVRQLTEQKALDFLKANGYEEAEKAKRTYCVLYQKGLYDNLDETFFDDLKKAKIFCHGQALEIKEKDVKNGAFCIVTDDYDPETGEYRTKLYDAIEERERWQAELDRERDEYEAKA